MAPRKVSVFASRKQHAPVVFFAALGLIAVVLTLQSGALGPGAAGQTLQFGRERLVKIEPMPELDTEMCPMKEPELEPASASASMFSALQTGGAAAPAGAAPPRPSDSLREQISQRKPVATMRDPHNAFAGLTIDPDRNEVIVAEENNFSLLVYDRTENTPPKAAMSEPKRMIQGENTYLEFACSVYVDPATGDIYGINNDTLNWMTVFDRNAKGNASPYRKLATPHTTFGMVADEERQELLMTIQDDQAIVVFPKKAKDQEAPSRLIQGPKTLMADPHGIALDPKNKLIFVTNWGSLNERTKESAPGTRLEGRAGRNRNKQNWPVPRENNIPGSGKYYPPSITVYEKDASGDVAPVRVISGPKTQMNWPTAIAVDPDRGELFVANDTADLVTVYQEDANGDVAPIRILKGTKTMIKNPTGIAVDLKNKELWVSNFGSHSATVFPIDAGGNVAPKRIIRSGPIDAPSPMMGNPHTIAFDTKRDELLVSN
jgi:DNA-binding beta-propeller fold protein YncE